MVIIVSCSAGVICSINEGIDSIIYEMNLDTVFLWIWSLELGICKADKTFRCHLAAKKDRKKVNYLGSHRPHLIKFYMGTLLTGDKAVPELKLS